MSDGGPAKTVALSTGVQQGGAALPVYEVTDGRATIGGPAQPVYVVTSGPVQGGTPVPIVTAAAGAVMTGGPAIPVYVVSGVIGDTLPVNTVLPVVSGGTAASISTTDGTWTGTTPITYTYQWKRNGAAIGGATNSTYTIVSADIGTTLTVTVTATNTAGSASATSAGYTPTYTQKIIVMAPIAYWPMAESSGVVALDASGNSRNGAYTGVTLGVAGIGDGRTAASFDGATSFNNIYSASFAGAFSGAAGSMIIWAKVSAAGVWTDGVLRRPILLQVDASNRTGMSKSATNNQLDWLYVAGGTVESGSAAAFSPTAYFHIALTWSKAADQVKFYVNGAQSGATATGIGTWAGALSTTQTLIGSLSTAAAQVWSGSLAHAAVFDRALTVAEVLAAATP